MNRWEGFKSSVRICNKYIAIYLIFVQIILHTNTQMYCIITMYENMISFCSYRDKNDQLFFILSLFPSKGRMKLKKWNKKLLNHNNQDKKRYKQTHTYTRVCIKLYPRLKLDEIERNEMKKNMLLAWEVTEKKNCILKILSSFCFGFFLSLPLLQFQESECWTHRFEKKWKNKLRR